MRRHRHINGASMSAQHRQLHSSTDKPAGHGEPPLRSCPGLGTAPACCAPTSACAPAPPPAPPSRCLRTQLDDPVKTNMAWYSLVLHSHGSRLCIRLWQLGVTLVDRETDVSGSASRQRWPPTCRASCVRDARITGAEPTGRGRGSVRFASRRSQSSLVALLLTRAPPVEQPQRHLRRRTVRFQALPWAHFSAVGRVRSTVVWEV